MTLTPDRIGYHAHGEVDDHPEPTVCMWPVFDNPARRPDNAPEDLGEAIDVVLYHLADGYSRRDFEVITFAHVVTDLDKALHLPGFLTLENEHTQTADTHGPDDWPVEVAATFESRIRAYLTDHYPEG